MMFDVQTIAIVCLFVVISAAVLLFISMVVTKEKTYEEAIAEQRQQTNALLTSQTKQKPKEKKQKKAGKKVKEKTNPVPIEQEIDETDGVDQSVENIGVTSQTMSSSHPKHHVEFTEPAVLEEQPTKDVNKRRPKKDKVRPILLNRDMSEEKIVLTPDCEVEPANHFEESHPKDEFELMHSQSVSLEKDNSPKREPVKEKLVKEKLNATHEAIPFKTKKMPKLQTVETTTQTNPLKEELPVQQVTQITQTNGLVSNIGKDKKKKKTEHNILEQLTAEKDGLNLQLLSSLVRKAELSRSEVQILIDMLLNKQHEAPAIIDEWSEGKADPVQKLKKQLAEKEKMLQEEQEALVSAQAKLKEVRSEQIAEKSQLQQKMRGLEEALNAKLVELQNVNGRLVGTQQKLQPLQEQLNNEMIKSHKLMEENGGYQMQIQQLQHIITQAQEKEMANEHQQSILAPLQHQNAIMKNEIDQKEDYIRKIEEAHKDLEHRYGMMQRQENDMQLEIAQLNATCQKQMEEFRISELTKVQALTELQNMKKYKEESDEIITKLKSEVLNLEEEKRQTDLSRENGVMEEKKAHQVEVMNLQNELSSLKSQMQENEKRYNANLDASIKRLETELAEQKDKNNETVTKIKLEQESMNKKFIQRLFPNIKVNENVTHEEWCEQIEGAISRYVNELEKPKTPEPVDNSELIKLQTENKRFKVIIADTEGVLNKLQNHVEQAEIQWTKKLENKDKELALLKTQLKQLQDQLDEMQQRLAIEEEENQKVLNENDTLNKGHIDRLTEDISNLTQQLEESQKRNSELQIQLDSLSNLAVKAINNHSSTSNGPAVTVETALSSASSATSSISEVKVKKNKKKKRKNNGN
ncbi:kinectin isoform X8 [Onthophagus taurus]|uniref:kinectin isoform X8 n=1 Tax=Onthophagus taurus TaxID=166361 RepID=UPI0039BE6855